MHTMKTAQEYREPAQQRLASAEHILSITYPAIKSPKLFLSVLEHLFLSMDYAMNSILVDDHFKKMAGKFPQTFSGRYSAFRMRMAKKLGFGKRDVETLMQLRSILIEHEKSPMEFERQEKLVICSGAYDLTLLSLEGMSTYARAAASFLFAAELATGKPLSMGSPLQL